MKYKLFFLLLFCNLNLSAQISISYGRYKQIINDSVFYNDELQIKRNDTIIFYWPSIIGLVKVHNLSHNDLKIECLYHSSTLINKEIESIEMIFCNILLNESKNRFEIVIDSITKEQSDILENTYDSLCLNSKNIHIDSLLTIDDQFKYLKLARKLSFDILNGRVMHLEKLNNFFVDFPFMQFNQLGQEILAYQNLGRIIVEYMLYE